MRMPAVQAVRQWLSGVPRWPLWSLKRPLRAYILAVIAVWLVVSSWASWSLWSSWSEWWQDSPGAGADAGLRSLATAGALVLCGAITIEATRKLAVAANQAWRDMLGVWTLPLLLVLPPHLALLIPVPLQILSHLRLRRALPHRVVFSIAAIGLAAGAASWVFHAFTGATFGPAPGWVFAGLAAGAVRFGINLVLVAVAVKASDPAAHWRGRIVSREGLASDSVELTAGLVVAVVCSVSPWLVSLTLPGLVFIVSRAALTVQLRALATTDHKTGLLSAGAWEREANLAITHALRTQAPLAVLMLDMDDFKQVNDTQGHLGGDAVLRVIASELTNQLRPTDLVGRFGGDEFAVLLPHTPPDAAYQVAERLRTHIADLVITSLSGTEVRVTVSVGMVVIPDAIRVDATDLLAAADHALYQSKRGGRNRTSRLVIGPGDSARS